jgi:hypothetical protein
VHKAAGIRVLDEQLELLGRDGLVSLMDAGALGSGSLGLSPSPQPASVSAPMQAIAAGTLT